MRALVVHLLKFRSYYERARAWQSRPQPAAPPPAAPTAAARRLESSKHYQTLGIGASAATPDIKKSFRALARTHHPDKHNSRQSVDKATEDFKTINAAYQALKDRTERHQYQANVLAGRDL